jgi:hypothetical protein
VSDADRVAGLVVRLGDDDAEPRAAGLVRGPFAFIAATEVRAVVEVGARTIVEHALGIGIGVAALGGQLVTLLDSGPASPSERTRQGVLSEIDSGESVLFMAGPVVATGLFAWTASREGISYEGRDVPVLPLGQLYRKVEARVWETRALATQGRPPASRRPEGRST